LPEKHLRRAESAPFLLGHGVQSAPEHFQGGEVWIVGSPVIIGPGLI
jgi:hypothetical protein